MSFEPRRNIDVDENAHTRLEPVTDLGDEPTVEVELVAQLFGVVDHAHIDRRRHLDRLASCNALTRGQTVRILALRQETIRAWWVVCAHRVSLTSSSGSGARALARERRLRG
jgi:hypothetical protein